MRLERDDLTATGSGRPDVRPWLLLAVLAAIVTAGTRPAMALNVGYYEMCQEQGEPHQVPPINAAGHTPVNLTDLTAADLAGVDVIFVDNCDNFFYGSEYLSRLADIEAAVAAGKVLVLHDRYVDAAETILPGGAGFDVVRELSSDREVEVLDGSTLVTSGPAGTITNTTLDGGCSSTHGYSVLGSLPGDARFILSRNDPGAIVTFAYGFGQGAVVYSTIPLDFYLAGSDCTIGPAVRAIYAPNVIHYAAALAGGSCGNGVTDPGETCDNGVANGAGSCCAFDCSLRPAGIECRADAGVCDVAESCDGVSAACPVDAFEPSSTVCRPAAGPCDVEDACTGSAADCPADEVLPDADGDTACDVLDNCVDDPNPGQEDDDGDDQGNACDACTNVVPTQQAKGTKIIVSKLNTPAGDDKLTFAAVFDGVPDSPTIDPVANGVRILLETALPNGLLLDAEIPGGAYDPVTKTGWTSTSSGFRYSSRQPAPLFGVKSITIRRTSVPGRIKASVKAGQGSFPVSVGEIPLKATLVLDAPTAETGQCGETTFSSPMCSFNGQASKVTCKQ